MSRRDGRSNRERDYEIKSQEAEVKEKERARRAQEIDDLESLLQSPKARRYLSSIIKRVGVFSESGSTNANVYIQNGKREVGLMILRDIKESAEQHLNEFLGESFNE